MVEMLSGRIISLYSVGSPDFAAEFQELTRDLHCVGKVREHIWFGRASVEEKHFLQLLGSQRDSVRVDIFRMVDLKRLLEIPFFLLRPNHAPLSLKVRMDSAELVECSRGHWLRLEHRILPVFDFARMKGKDIFHLYLDRPPDFIVSRRLKHLMEEECITGYELLPCVDIAEYEKDRGSAELVPPSRYPAKESDFYKVVINGCTKGPYMYDRYDESMVCPECNTLLGMFKDGVCWIQKEHLLPVDLQVCDTVRNIDGPVHNHLVRQYLCSGRLLNLIVQNRMKSLSGPLRGSIERYPVVETDETIRDLGYGVPVQGE